MAARLVPGLGKAAAEALSERILRGDLTAARFAADAKLSDVLPELRSRLAIETSESLRRELQGLVAVLRAAK